MMNSLAGDSDDATAYCYAALEPPHSQDAL